MNDKEILKAYGHCWACHAGLTALHGERDIDLGYVKCECPPRPVKNLDSFFTSLKPLLILHGVIPDPYESEEQLSLPLEL